MSIGREKGRGDGNRRQRWTYKDGTGRFTGCSQTVFGVIKPSGREKTMGETVFSARLREPAGHLGTKRVFVGNSLWLKENPKRDRRKSSKERPVWRCNEKTRVKYSSNINILEAPEKRRGFVDRPYPSTNPPAKESLSGISGERFWFFHFAYICLISKDFSEWPAERDLKSFGRGITYFPPFFTKIPLFPLYFSETFGRGSRRPKDFSHVISWSYKMGRPGEFDSHDHRERDKKTHDKKSKYVQLLISFIGFGTLVGSVVMLPVSPLPVSPRVATLTTTRGMRILV